MNVPASEGKSHRPETLSLVRHFSEVWKCEITVFSFLIPSSTLLRCVEVWDGLTNVTLFPTPDPSVILNLVVHFSEVWKCGKVWQSQDNVILSPSHNPFVILYLVLHFSKVWKCGIVWQSKDNVTLFPYSRTPCHSLLSSTLLRGMEVWKSH